MPSFRRRRRLARLLPTNAEMPTVEGILTGRTAGHYRVEQPKLVHQVDGAAAPSTVSLDGYLEVPAERVAFVQVIAREGTA